MDSVQNYKSTTIEVIEGGIMCCKAFRNDLYDSKDLKKLFDIMMGMSTTDKLLVLMNLSEAEIVLTKDARKYLQSDYMVEKNVLAEAVIMQSAVSHLIYNSILKFYPPKFPFRAFKSHDSAVAWLTEHSMAE